MDPTILSIIVSVAANGLTSLLAAGGRATSASLGLRAGDAGAPLSGILAGAIEEVSDTMPWDGPPRVEEACLFLATPEVESMARQIYAVRLLPGPADSLEEIRRRFRASFARHARRPADEIATSADRLFDALVDGCGRALNRAIDAGALSAHDAKSGLRHRILLDELHALRGALTLLSGPAIPDLPAILRFEETYRGQVGQRHGYITPSYVDSARRYAIDDIYVAPHLARVDAATPGGARVGLDVFLATAYRAVILGHPGGGKSTLAAKVCHDLATRYDARLFGGRPLTPILVVLRDYAAAKATRPCSIAHFIATSAASTYQIPAPADAVDYLLTSGRAMVVFDGLDELLDTRLRREIAGDVGSFCALYPAVPALVTSREVGYEQAPLDGDVFATYRLAQFDDTQVADYVARWFARDPYAPGGDRDARAVAFLRESAIVPDLRANPLMLDLMCNLYRRENYIPRNRPAVYEACATLLFERWDRHRDIRIDLPPVLESQMRPLMEHLAEWMYTDTAAQTGATEGQLVERTADYLHPRRYDDRDDARASSRAFIDVCRGRAWVFTDTGTTAEGERLYQFTHRTFLEYFTAARLVHRTGMPGPLLEILGPRIEAREWDMVAQLAVQIMGRHVQDASDTLIEALLDPARLAPDAAGWNTLSFAVRCLQFLTPSLGVVRTLAGRAIERCVARGAEDRRAGTPAADDDTLAGGGVERVLGALQRVSEDNRPATMAAVEHRLADALGHDDEDIAMVAYEIALLMRIRMALTRYESEDEIAAHSDWRVMEDRVVTSAPIERIRALAARSLLLCGDAYWRGLVPIGDYLAWHGAGGFFRGAHFTIREMSATPSALDVLTAALSLTDADVSDGRMAPLAQLADVGSTLPGRPRPWLEAGDIEDMDHALIDVQDPDNPWPQPDEPQQLVATHLAQSEQSFGLFLLLATLGEVDPSTIVWLMDLAGVVMDPIIALARARYHPETRADADRYTRECGWSDAQCALAWRWAHDHESFSAARERDGGGSDPDGDE